MLGKWMNRRFSGLKEPKSFQDARLQVPRLQRGDTTVTNLGADDSLIATVQEVGRISRAQDINLTRFGALAASYRKHLKLLAHNDDRRIRVRCKYLTNAITQAVYLMHRTLFTASIPHIRLVIDIL